MTKEGTTITALLTTKVKSTEITPDVTSSTETTEVKLAEITPDVTSSTETTEVKSAEITPDVTLSTKTTEVKSAEITPDVTSSTKTTEEIIKTKSKKDISIRDIFNASQGEVVSLPGKFFGDILCLPEFGGQIKEGRGVIFMISDYHQNRKKAMRIIKRPFKNGKVAFIPINMMDKIAVVRQKANKGVFSTIFEYVLIEVNGAYSNFINGIVKEKGYGPFLPRSIDDQFKMAVYDKLQSTETIPLYCKCFKSVNTNNWYGFETDKINDSHIMKFDEKQMLKEIIYTKSSTIFVIKTTIEEDFLVIEWRLHNSDFKSKTIKERIKTWKKKIKLNDEINKNELLFYSSGNKIKEIVQKYGIQADKEGKEYYLLSALR